MSSFLTKKLQKYYNFITKILQKTQKSAKFFKKLSTLIVTYARGVISNLISKDLNSFNLFLERQSI